MSKRQRDTDTYMYIVGGFVIVLTRGYLSFEEEKSIRGTSPQTWWRWEERAARELPAGLSAVGLNS